MALHPLKLPRSAAHLFRIVALQKRLLKALADPEFETHKAEIIKEIRELLNHESSEIEGVFLDQLSERLDLDESP